MGRGLTCTERCKCDCECESLGVLFTFIAWCVGVILLITFSGLVVARDAEMKDWDHCTCFPPLANIKFEGSDSIAMRWLGEWTFLCGDLNGTVTNQYPALDSLYWLGAQTRSKVQSNLASVQSVQSIDCQVNTERTKSFTNRINYVGWSAALTIGIILLIITIVFVVWAFRK